MKRAPRAAAAAPAAAPTASRDASGLDLVGPAAASDIAEELDHPFRGESSLRSVAFHSGAAVAVPSAERGDAAFHQDARTFFRSAQVQKEANVAVAPAHHARTAPDKLLRPRPVPSQESAAVAISATPLPKSPLFTLEPLSHFRVSAACGAQPLAASLDRALRRVLGCGVDVEQRASRWRCVASSSYSYVQFNVTLFSDGFDADGHPEYVVEAQRRSGCVADFVAMYKVIKAEVLARAKRDDEGFEGGDDDAAAEVEVPARAAAPESLRQRVMPLPPADLVASAGGDPHRMAVEGFEELLGMAGSAASASARIEVMAALARLACEAGTCAALAGESEAVRGACAKLVELLGCGCIKTSSYAANTLARLSEETACRDVLRDCGCVQPLATAAARDGPTDEVGVRRGCGRVLRNLVEEPLAGEDLASLNAFLRAAQASDDHVLCDCADEAGQALGVQG
uniref:Uncharacterized protein n=2 Tax=Phaeomonas parva TaxID=124430 RepID=A0A7S1U1I3_9STRA|mmetsp:Transcript_26778/g.83858  ORF Transcript_26778/g.83858 Transcript_26778/m.83858 type:complete len:456 (+) Transcript_26778:352-1719(+)